MKKIILFAILVSAAASAQAQRKATTKLAATQTPALKTTEPIKSGHVAPIKSGHIATMPEPMPMPTAPIQVFQKKQAATKKN